MHNINSLFSLQLLLLSGLFPLRQINMLRSRCKLTRRKGSPFPEVDLLVTFFHKNSWSSKEHQFICAEHDQSAIAVSKRKHFAAFGCPDGRKDAGPFKRVSCLKCNSVAMGKKQHDLMAFSTRGLFLPVRFPPQLGKPGIFQVERHSPSV